MESGKSALMLLGLGAEEAQKSAVRFREHNLELMAQMHPHFRDRNKLIAVVKQGRQQLEEQLAQERAMRANGQAAKPSQSSFSPAKSIPP
jgi:glutathione-regulated potassium-efflux system ancillary protein KefC